MEIVVVYYISTGISTFSTIIFYRAVWRCLDRRWPHNNHVPCHCSEGVSCAGAGPGQGGGPGSQEAGQAAGPGVALQRDDSSSNYANVDTSSCFNTKTTIASSQLCVGTVWQLGWTRNCSMLLSSLCHIGRRSSGCVPSDEHILPDAVTVRQMTKLLRMRIKNIFVVVQSTPAPAGCCRWCVVQWTLSDVSISDVSCSCTFDKIWDEDLWELVSIICQAPPQYYDLQCLMRIQWQWYQTKRHRQAFFHIKCPLDIIAVHNHILTSKIY